MPQWFLKTDKGPTEKEVGSEVKSHIYSLDILLWVMGGSDIVLKGYYIFLFIIQDNSTN